jgi:hypothetical protein
MTRPQLRERLARAVIAADPDGAERRRAEAERHADVRLYADEDQTATITASRQPQIHAAAAYARITAMARARKAAGLPGSLGFHRSQVMLGLMLDTLPYIPPADGAPPDQPPHDPRDESGPGGDDPTPADDHGPEGNSLVPDDHDHSDERHRDFSQSNDSYDDNNHSDGRHGGDRHGDAGHCPGPWDDLPAPLDEDAPPDDGLDDGPEADARQGWHPDEEDDNDLYGTGPATAWPELGAIPPALARQGGPADGRPVPGLLDVLLPWTTLAGLSQAPGMLGRIGAVTAAQARQLARAADTDPAAQWRVIVTNAAGQAITVTRIRRPSRRARGRPGPARNGSGPARDIPVGCRDKPPPGAGLVGRITITITQEAITARQADGPRGPEPPGGPSPPVRPGPLRRVAVAALRAATKALYRALDQAQADAAAGGCAHAYESPAYRPPPRLREHVIARDVTCRSPVCRQPAWRADLDHTRPYHQHGRTCWCNLGGGCRRDHQLKQHRRWRLDQIRPGVFQWTTPAGRTYTVRPDAHPV